jgi:hypothetical protein
MEVGVGGRLDATNLCAPVGDRDHPHRLRPHGVARRRPSRPSPAEKAGILQARRCPACWALRLRAGEARDAIVAGRRAVRRAAHRRRSARGRASGTYRWPYDGALHRGGTPPSAARTSARTPSVVGRPLRRRCARGACAVTPDGGAARVAHRALAREHGARRRRAPRRRAQRRRPARARRGAAATYAWAQWSSAPLATRTSTSMRDTRASRGCRARRRALRDGGRASTARPPPAELAARTGGRGACESPSEPPCRARAARCRAR